VVTIQQASTNACNNMQLQPVTLCQDGMGQYMTLDMPSQVLQEQQPGLDLTSAQLQVLIDSMQSSSVNADLSSVPGMVAVDNSISSVSGALSVPQMAITMQGPDQNASMPMIVQVQMPAPTQCVQQTLAGPEISLQHMQPVYTTLQGQQVVLVNGPAVTGTIQPQLAACTGTVVSSRSGSAVQVQLQQLQDAVQQLSSQTAAVQQMLLTAQHTQDTTTAATGYVQVSITTVDQHTCNMGSAWLALLPNVRAHSYPLRYPTSHPLHTHLTGLETDLEQSHAFLCLVRCWSVRICDQGS
jgi:hypothetical protein